MDSEWYSFLRKRCLKRMQEQHARYLATKDKVYLDATVANQAKAMQLYKLQLEAELAEAQG